MDALDYLVKRVREDSSMGNVTFVDDHVEWGELLFECTDDNLINIYHHDFDDKIGVYSVDQAFEVLQGHQEMFSG